MLELHKTIRVLHIIPYTIVLILFYDQDWERRAFKVMKNEYFLVFLVVGLFSPSYWAG